MTQPVAPTPPLSLAAAPVSTVPSESTTTTTTSTSTSTSTSTVESVDAELAAWLAEDRVGESWARRELYTWTTPDQFEELRMQPFLLTRSESPVNGPALFDRRMREAAAGAVGKLLGGKALSLRRFAWVAPWATHAGWEDEKYGDVLVRVVLKDDAVVGRYDGRAESRWAFQTVAGAAVSEADVLAHPERLAAVYHVWYGGDEGATDRQAHAFREYVLCNESMIASWEIGTTAIVQRVARDRRMMARLAAAQERMRTVSPNTSAEWQTRVLGAWAGPPGSGLVAQYEAALAFVNPLYLFSAASLQAQSSALERLTIDARAPMVTRPKIAFGQAPPNVVRPAPPAARRPCRGTFCS
jgi:hypothetical protein